MFRLFIDTSSDYLSIVISEDSRIAASLKLSSGRKISEELPGQIDRLLFACGIGISNIDEIYAITGPGSFTGVRIGVAMALGLSEGISKPCYGIVSLDAAALSSDKPNCKAASRLKGNIFAVRSYDFINNIFSPFFCTEINDVDLANYICVNTGAGTSVNLEKTVLSGRYEEFRGDCAPLYLRKSEAEINIDKKRSYNRP